MRATARLFAAVKAAKFLEPNAPTGLTGLLTHPAPRPALIYLYNATLSKLKALPESSAYRQSTEAITRHRLAIVRSEKPEGYEVWKERAAEIIRDHPNAFKDIQLDGTDDVETVEFVKLVLRKPDVDDRQEEWDGEKFAAVSEGSMANEEDIYDRFPARSEEINEPVVNWEHEPLLRANQVANLEDKIGAGLIEEVIQVAQGELKLVDEMVKAKVWEDLEEKPDEGQWSYFERDAHTPPSSKS